MWNNDPKRTLGPQVKEGRVGSYLVEDVLLKLYMKQKHNITQLLKWIYNQSQSLKPSP